MFPLKHVLHTYLGGPSVGGRSRQEEQHAGSQEGNREEGFHLKMILDFASLKSPSDDWIVFFFGGGMRLLYSTDCLLTSLSNYFVGGSNKKSFTFGRSFQFVLSICRGVFYPPLFSPIKAQEHSQISWNVNFDQHLFGIREGLVGGGQRRK